jgi:hypothetical protein
MDIGASYGVAIIWRLARQWNTCFTQNKHIVKLLYSSSLGLIQLIQFSVQSKKDLLYVLLKCNHVESICSPFA